MGSKWVIQFFKCITDDEAQQMKTLCNGHYTHAYTPHDSNVSHFCLRGTKQQRNEMTKILNNHNIEYIVWKGSLQ